MQKEDKINPNHYKNGKIECIDALESATVGKKGLEAVCVANVIKYLWRYEDKNGIEDVRKAKWYLNALACKLEEDIDDAFIDDTNGFGLSVIPHPNETYTDLERPPSAGIKTGHINM